jgi:hypothetical protein
MERPPPPPLPPEPGSGCELRAQTAKKAAAKKQEGAEKQAAPREPSKSGHITKNK